MFTVLMLGIYAAYKQFSGLDPLKLDPLAVFNNVIAARTPKQFTDALSSLKIDSKILGKSIQLSNPSSQPLPSQPPFFRFLLIADSHSDNYNLQKAINQAKQDYPDIKFVIGLGDYSKVGTTLQLQEAKEVLDTSSLRYFLVPGDHDLWDCRDKNLPPTNCFKQVFGPNYQTFTFENFKFLMLDNSDDYLGFDDTQLQWIESELEKAKEESIKGIFVFLHEPLFHPSSDHVMGKVEKNLPAGRQGLKTQARNLEFVFKDAGVKKVFSGDTHYSSEYKEPVTGLDMVTIGAVTIERNPQAPRFAVVSVSEDGLTKVEDIEIK
ncbi:metallophosphoesterase [Candidatus Daviesbacteria bacterium]|nr:metallophosphoesterase [Candidatus Daviesbacteria bacterium]